MGIAYFLFFLIVSFVNFYIPGFVILQKLKIDIPSPFGVVEWITGCSMFILGSFLSAWTGAPWVYLVIVAILTALFLRKFRTNFGLFVKEWQQCDIITISLLFLGTVAFTSVMFFSGWLTSSGIQFLYTNTSDGIRHLAYIKSQITFFPPQRPGLSGVDFRGFHYFYDFMLSRFSLFFGFAPRDLYFRFFPVLISFFYGASFIFAARKIKAKISQERLILFFAYFAQSFSFLYWFFDKNVDLTNAAVVQSLGLIINPFTVLSIPMLLVSLAVIPEMKKNWRIGIVVGLLLGILCQTKVYAGLAGIGTLVSYSLYSLGRYRLKYIRTIIGVNVVTAILTIITYFPNNYGAGGLIFAPFLLVKEYMQRPILNGFHWELQRQVFSEHNNYIRIIILYLEALVFYIFINFGIRTIILMKVRTIFSISFWKNEINFLFFTCVSLLILLGSFFIQTVSVFDTIQFYWIALSLLCVPTGFIVAQYLSSLKNKTVMRIILVCIVAITIPGNIDFLMKYLTLNKALIVPSSQMDVYNAIKRSTLPNEILVYLPKSVNEDFGSPLVAAITGRPIYLEGGGVPNNYTDDLVHERKEKVQKLFQALRKCDKTTILSIMKQMGSINLVGYGLDTCPIENSIIYLDKDTHFAYLRLKN